MIKLKDILKEASGNQMTFGEYGYSVKQVEPEIKKVLGGLIKSIEQYSNDKDEIGHIKFNFKDKESMKKFLSKDDSYIDSIEKLLSRKFGVDVMIHLPPVDSVGNILFHNSSMPSTNAASSITSKESASERPALSLVEEALIHDPLLSSKLFLLSTEISAMRNQSGANFIIFLTFLTRLAATSNLVAITNILFCLRNNNIQAI